MKRSNSIFVLICILALVTVSDGMAKQPKADICHITGTRDFDGVFYPIGHVINISQAALQSHIDHGDLQYEAYMMLPDEPEACTDPNAFAGDSEPDPAPDLCYQAADGKMIFLTSEKIPVEMIGITEQIDQITDPIEKADAVCNYYAQKASLCGSYKAWLAINNAPAPLPPLTDFPLVDTNNSQIADNYDDLYHKIVNEWGDPIVDIKDTPRIVWIGTGDFIFDSAVGMTACCDGDGNFECSKVGYEINSMGLDTSDPFSEKFFNFLNCAGPVTYSNTKPSRMYCIQQ